MSFKKNFETLCVLKGCSLGYACTAIGLSDGAHSKWTDNTKPRAKTLYKAAEFFGVKPDNLLVDTDQWIKYEGTFIPALADDTPDTPSLPPIEWAQEEVEAGARAARRCQIIDRTAAMSLAQLEQIIGILDLMFPLEN